MNFFYIGHFRIQKGHVQPVCIAGVQITNIIFCDTESTNFPIVFTI